MAETFHRRILLADGLGGLNAGWWGDEDDTQAWSCPSNRLLQRSFQQGLDRRMSKGGFPVSCSLNDTGASLQASLIDTMLSLLYR